MCWVALIFWSFSFFWCFLNDNANFICPVERMHHFSAFLTLCWNTLFRWRAYWYSYWFKVFWQQTTAYEGMREGCAKDASCFFLVLVISEMVLPTFYSCLSLAVNMIPFPEKSEWLEVLLQFPTYRLLLYTFYIELTSTSWISCTRIL